MKTPDLEHPNQPDPLKRNDPFARPEPELQSDSASVVAKETEIRDLRKLAELAGGPVSLLKEF